MEKIWLLTKKNLQLLLRSKSSALIVIFAPLLIILIIGLSYDTSDKYGLNIGVHSTPFNDDANSFTELLQEKEFSITKYSKALQDCINDIKREKVHTCISLPNNFNLEDNSPKEITFYVDRSRINLVWMIQETIKTKFNIKANEISEELSGNILTKLINTKNKIEEKRSNLQVIRDKSYSASKTTSSAQDSLSNIDISIIENNYDKSIISSLNTQVTNSLTNVKKAIGDLNDINDNSSKKDEVKKSLKEARDELETVSINLVEGSENGLSNLISSLENDLTNTKNKLNEVGSSIGITSSDLSNIKQNLQEGLSDIDDLLTSLSEIKDDLDSQKITNATVIASPLTMKIENVERESTYLNYLFPAILVLVVMFSSLLLGTSLVMMEKNSPAFIRNFFIPTKTITFVTSTYLTNMILILVEIAIILGISLFFLQGIISLVPQITLVLFVTSSVFTFLGMSLGYLFTSEETGTLASISLGSLLLFMSGVILPLEGISSFIRNIAFMNPFVISEKIIREIFIFKSSISQVWIDLALLASYAIVLFLLILTIELILQKHIIKRFIKHHHKQHKQKDIISNKDA